MLGFLKYGIPFGLIVGVAAFAYGTHTGKTGYQKTLLEKRIITKDQVRKVDNEVSSSDESGLCALLGGC